MELELSKLVPETIKSWSAVRLAVLVGLSTEATTRGRWRSGRRCSGTTLTPRLLAAAILPGSTAPLRSTTAVPAGAISFLRPISRCWRWRSGLLSILAAWNMPAKSDPSVADSKFRGEFFSMMLFSIAGVSMVGKVNDLVWLFVVLELVSIPDLHHGGHQSRRRSSRRKCGHQILLPGGVFGGGTYLFGFSYIYGIPATRPFDQIAHYFAAISKTRAPCRMLPLIGVLMVLVGVSYKMAVVPLHFYAGDVYQGAATPVTAFLAFAPKTAGGLIAIIHTLEPFQVRLCGAFGSSGLAISTRC